MRTKIISLLVLLAFLNTSAQNNRFSDLQKQLAAHPQQDTFRVNRLTEIAVRQELSIAARDSAADEALLLSRKLNYKEGEVETLMAQAQTKDKAQAKNLLQQALTIAEALGNKTLTSKALRNLGLTLATTEETDLALHYLLKSVAVAQATDDKALLALAQLAMGEYYLIYNGNYVKALDWGLKALHTAEQANSPNALALVYIQLAGVYFSAGDNATSLVYFQKALEANIKLGNKFRLASLFNNKGEVYKQSGKYPEALQAYRDARAQITDDPYLIELVEGNMADVYDRMGNYPVARKYAFRSLNTARKTKDPSSLAWMYSILGRISLHMDKPDSALYYGNSGYDAALKVNYLEMKRDNSQVLANAYAQNKLFDKAYAFQNLYFGYRDSMMNNDIKNKTSLLKYNADLQKKQVEIAALNKDKQLQKAEAQRQYYFLIGALVTLVLIAALVLVLYRNNRQKQSANLQLTSQKQKVESTLQELKATQAQLIQSEKMASLGELTAGIAHEIQNPLNFVNNFSEVNDELISELVDEVDKGNTEEVKAIAKDIIQNLEKINHHGKRADAIVKGMLQHSRKSEGKKELIDINVLCDEYLRLAYHGMKAKDKAFKADIKTDFDVTIGNINIVRQDIGRVLLNLFNNAFYSINEKSQQLSANGYQPRVSVQTKRLNETFEIRIVDNGNGIPQNIIDKIFQPFFTTKPTGQGTGLGLSLAYDIVKAHGGEIKVEANEKEGSAFIINLPFNT